MGGALFLGRETLVASALDLRPRLQAFRASPIILTTRAHKHESALGEPVPRVEVTCDPPTRPGTSARGARRRGLGRVGCLPSRRTTLPKAEQDIGSPAEALPRTGPTFYSLQGRPLGNPKPSRSHRNGMSAQAIRTRWTIGGALFVGWLLFRLILWVRSLALS